MSTTNFDKQVVKDIDFVKSILPNSYKVGESKKLGSVHCVSEIGIVKSPFVNSTGRMITDDEDEVEWSKIFRAIKNHFGERFQEVYHNTCTNHVDFTIYLKK